jgi:hypothetical protein
MKLAEANAVLQTMCVAGTAADAKFVVLVKADEDQKFTYRFVNMGPGEAIDLINDAKRSFTKLAAEQ